MVGLWAMRWLVRDRAGDCMWRRVGHRLPEIPMPMDRSTLKEELKR